MDGFRVQLGFTDNTERIVDLEPYLRGPIFEPLREDPEQFRAVQVDPEFGTIVWPNGAGLCPDVLAAQEETEPDNRQELKGRAIAAIGRFRSDVADLSVEHDRYLEEAFDD